MRAAIISMFGGGISHDFHFANVGQFSVEDVASDRRSLWSVSFGHAQSNELFRIWEQIPKIDCYCEWNVHIVIKWEKTTFRCGLSFRPNKTPSLKYLNIGELRFSLRAVWAQKCRSILSYRNPFIFINVLYYTHIGRCQNTQHWLHNNDFFARPYVKTIVVTNIQQRKIYCLVAIFVSNKYRYLANYTCYLSIIECILIK